MKTQERFDVKWKLDSKTGCHLWVAALDTSGYGLFWDGRHVKAHRWAYAQKHGPIPLGAVMDHFACDVKRCVNPDHVRPVSPRENVLRGSAMRPLATHCKRGHEFTEENTFQRKDRLGRECKECRRENVRRFRRHR